MQQKTTTKFCLNICSSMLNVKILVCVGCLFLWFEVLNGSLLLQKRYEKIFALSFARFFVGEHFLFWFGINQISPRLFSLLKFKRRAKWRTTICLVPFSEDKTLLWLATVWKFYLNIVFFSNTQKKAKISRLKHGQTKFPKHCSNTTSHKQGGLEKYFPVQGDLEKYFPVQGGLEKYFPGNVAWKNIFQAMLLGKDLT